MKTLKYGIKSLYGNKWISELITNITPDLTLFVNKFGKDSTDQMELTWLSDSMAPPKENKQSEKIEFTDVDTAVDDRIRMKNYVQHFATSFWISDLSEKVAKYGVKSEMEYQMVKKLKEVAQDFEYAIINNTSMALMGTGNTNTAKGQLAGIKYFVGGEAVTFTSNTSTDKVTLSGITEASPFYYLRTGDAVSFYTVSDTLPTGITANKTYYVNVTDALAAGAISFTLFNSVHEINTGGTKVDITNVGSNTGSTNKVARSNVNYIAGAFAEDRLNDLMEKVWKVGGQIGTLYMSGANKRVASGWTSSAQKTMAINEKKLTNVKEIYESDFGIVEMKIHRMLGNDRVELLNESDWKITYLQPFHTEDAPRTGTYKRKFISGVATLKARSPYSGGALIGLTTS